MLGSRLRASPQRPPRHTSRQLFRSKNEIRVSPPHRNLRGVAPRALKFNGAATLIVESARSPNERIARARAHAQWPKASRKCMPGANKETNSRVNTEPRRVWCKVGDYFALCECARQKLRFSTHFPAAAAERFLFGDGLIKTFTLELFCVSTFLR